MRERWISKFKIKEFSWVYVPTEKTIEIGNGIKKSIEQEWSPPRNYYHLRNGGHIESLKQHINNDYFIHIDLLNFFGQINRSRITRCLKQYFSYNKAREIAIESTVRFPKSEEKKYILPFGFVQSPILASICLNKSKLGQLLNSMHKSSDIKVSVYMDDIILSGTDKAILEKALEEITRISERSGLPINKKKLEGPKNKITSFNIHLSKNELLISDKRLEEFLHEYVNSYNSRQKSGILNYVFSVNPSQANKLLI